MYLLAWSVLTATTQDFRSIAAEVLFSATAHGVSRYKTLILVAWQTRALVFTGMTENTCLSHSGDYDRVFHTSDR